MPFLSNPISTCLSFLLQVPAPSAHMQLILYAFSFAMYTLVSYVHSLPNTKNNLHLHSVFKYFFLVSLQNTYKEVSRLSAIIVSDLQKRRLRTRIISSHCQVQGLPLWWHISDSFRIVHFSPSPTKEAVISLRSGAAFNMVVLPTLTT